MRIPAIHKFDLGEFFCLFVTTMAEFSKTMGFEEVELKVKELYDCHAFFFSANESEKQGEYKSLHRIGACRAMPVPCP